MAGREAPDGDVVLETDRLLLKPWRVAKAALAVLDWASSSGYTRLRAMVRDWNTASRRVLAKAGFIETDRVERDEVDRNTVFTAKQL